MRLKRPFSLLLICFLTLGQYSVHASKIDSLKHLLNEPIPDSSRIKIIQLIAYTYNNLNITTDDELEMNQEALNLSIKHNYFNSEASAYSDIGLYYEYKGGNNDKVLENFFKAFDVCEKNNLKEELCNNYILICNFYRTYIKNSKKGLEYALKALEIAKQADLKQITAKALAVIGNVYIDMNDYRQAILYLSSAQNEFSALNNKDNAATILNNIGVAYTELKAYDSAIACYQKSLSIYKEENNNDGVATSLANIGNLYDMRGNPEQGVNYSLQALAIARPIGDKDLIAGIYSFLAEGYSKMNDYEKAFQYQSDLVNLKDTLFDEESTKQVNDMQVKYDTEKKEKENKILELNINRQKIINYSITVGLVLITVLVFFIYRGYINKKKAHEELEVKNKIIEEKNKDILDSINYAKTIQNAILTPDEYLKEELKDYFIVYKPRDVVSGDFYWCYTHGSKVIFTVADCTGHGVPGAFMSMIGNSLLNEVVIENKVTDAAQILTMLRTNLLKTLQQKGQNTITRDGMDIALCVWDKNTNTIEFAGANNAMYLVRNSINGSIQNTEHVKIHGDNLAEFIPDKQPIGYFENKTDEPFHSQSVQLQRGDIIYISTDGYIDQFGGEKGKKFTRKRFRDILTSLANMSLEEQKDALDKTLETWKGRLEQTDDICLMGVKFS